MSRLAASRVAFAGALWCLSAAATASSVTIDITATVAYVDDAYGVLNGQVVPGQVIRGRYSYESTTPDTNPLPTVGDYWHATPPAGIRLEAGPFVFETDPSNVQFLVEIVDDHGAPARDNYLLRSYVNRANTPLLAVDHIAWQLDDPTSAALSSTVLPTGPPDLPSWQSIFGLTIEGNAPGPLPQPYFIRAHVTSAVAAALSYHTLTPCRAVDTRNPDGPLGGPALAAGLDRVFTITGTCNVPSTARAVAVNLSVTGPTTAGNLRLHPGGTPVPLASALNYSAGQTRGNNAIVPLSALGQIAVYCSQVSGTTHFILDVSGYFE